MSDKWVEIKTNDYLLPIYADFGGEKRSTGMCTLCIQPSDDYFWHVGTSILQEYYAEFNMPTRTLTLQPLASGSKNSL